MIEPEGPEIERRLELSASPGEVVAYLVDPAKLATWEGARVMGMDLGRGGEFRLEIASGRAVLGRFLDVLPGRRLAMT